MKTRFFVFSLVVWTCSISAGQNPVQAPIVGYFLDDSSSAVRPIHGMPGASYVGLPLALPFEVASAEFAADHSFALVVEKTDRALWFVPLAESRQGSSAPVDGVLAEADGVSLSPQGTAAVVYRSRDSRVQILRVHTSGARVEAELEVAGLDGPGGLARVSDDVRVAAFAHRDGDRAVVSIWTAEAGLQRLTDDRADAMIFVPGSADLVVGDSSRQEVVMWSRLSGVPARTVLADDRTLPAGMSDVAVDPESGTIAVASRSGATVSLIQNGLLTARLNCACTLSGLMRMKGQNVFRLSHSVNGSPMWLFDGASAEPRVVFVPAFDRAPNGEPRR